MTKNPRAKDFAPGQTTLELARKVCSNCLQPPSSDNEMRLCSGCKRAAYCSTACRDRDWKLHKKLCRPLQDFNAQQKERWAQVPNATREMRIQMRTLDMMEAHVLGIDYSYVLRGIMHCALCLRTPYQGGSPTATYTCCSRCELAWWCSDECKENFNEAHSSVDCKALRALACVERFSIDYHIKRRQFQPVMVTSPVRSTYLDIRSLSGWREYFRKVFTDHDGQMNVAAWEFQKNNKDAKLAATLLTQDTLTIPLTIVDGLAHAFPDLSRRKSLRIHILGAEEREADSTGITEELLHLLPALQSLDICYIGPSATRHDVGYTKGNTACTKCQGRGRTRTLHPYSSTYHECPWSRAGDPSAPDFVVAFNSGMTEVVPEGWRKSLQAVLDLAVPALFTAYTLMEASREEKLVREVGAKIIRGVTDNKWASGVPMANMYWSDEDRMGDDGHHTIARNNRWTLMVKGRDV